MKSILRIFGGVVVGIALMVSFSFDLGNTNDGGSVDLRNRITGVRLMEHGIDPYHFIWHPGDPAEYCDLRNNPHLTISLTTVTPPLLLLFSPLAMLPYRQTQYLWLFAHWLLLAGTVWLWIRLCPSALRRWSMVVFVTAFTYTQGWRWEAERGQSYLLLDFILACWMIASIDPKRANGFATGLVAGLLVALRPPFVLLLPFLALHRRGQLPGAITGLVLGVGLPLLVFPAGWTDYSSAMHTYYEVYRNGVVPPKGPQAFPPIIEGTPSSILGHIYPFHFVDFSAYALLRGFHLPPTTTLPLFAIVLFLVWLWWSRRQPVENLLPGLVAWFFLIDLFLPSIRYTYYDLLILNVVLAGIVVAKGFPWAIMPCVLALPFGWVSYHMVHLPLSILYLTAAFFTLGAVLSLFSFVRRPASISD